VSLPYLVTLMLDKQHGIVSIQRGFHIQTSTEMITIIIMSTLIPVYSMNDMRKHTHVLVHAYTLFSIMLHSMTGQLTEITIYLSFFPKIGRSNTAITNPSYTLHA
jgi:hypothetical protein